MTPSGKELKLPNSESTGKRLFAKYNTRNRGLVKELIQRVLGKSENVKYTFVGSNSYKQNRLFPNNQ